MSAALTPGREASGTRAWAAPGLIGYFVLSQTVMAGQPHFRTQYPDGNRALSVP